MRVTTIAVFIALLVGIATYCMAAPPGIERPQYEFRMVEPPTTRFTNRWVIVADTSASGQSVLSKVLFGYDKVMEFTADDFQFAMYSFNSATYFREWEQVTPDSVARNKAWMRSTAGVLSRVTRGLAGALREREPHLTIIIISDGGFTEASGNKGFSGVEQTVINGQAWRVENGLFPAIITTVGIENIGYVAGGKAPDAECQEFLRHLGSSYEGGYWLVR